MAAKITLSIMDTLFLAFIPTQGLAFHLSHDEILLSRAQVAIPMNLQDPSKDDSMMRIREDHIFPGRDKRLSLLPRPKTMKAYAVPVHSSGRDHILCDIMYGSVLVPRATFNDFEQNG